MIRVGRKRGGLSAVCCTTQEGWLVKNTGGPLRLQSGTASGSESSGQTRAFHQPYVRTILVN